MPGRYGAAHGVPYYVYNAISSWVVYHFHDTSLTAGVRRQKPINDNELFRSDAENLAAFLYRLRATSPGSYTRIREVVRLAAPFFDDFKLRPVPTDPDLIQLEWLRNSDYPFRAHQLSDGTHASSVSPRRCFSLSVRQRCSLTSRSLDCIPTLWRCWAIS
jgi:predicted ATPase